MRPDGENRIQKEHTLAGPFCQTAVIRNITAKIIVELLIDIFQRRRDLYAGFHGKTQAMRLSLFMVGILAQNHNTHFMKRGKMKGIQDISCRGIYLISCILLTHFPVKLRIVWFPELRSKPLQPVIVNCSHHSSPIQNPSALPEHGALSDTPLLPGSRAPYSETGTQPVRHPPFLR